MSFSKYRFSVKPSGVNDGFVITQHERDSTDTEINSVVVDDTSIIPQKLLNDEFHNCLNHYYDDYVSIKKLKDTTIYTAFDSDTLHRVDNITCSVTIDTEGAIVKVESYDKVLYDKYSDSFEKVDPREHIIPRLWRFILFTRQAPRGKYFSSIFIENETF
jgi:hypothetical protein